jgi:hypothetical protein
MYVYINPVLLCLTQSYPAEWLLSQPVHGWFKEKERASEKRKVPSCLQTTEYGNAKRTLYPRCSCSRTALSFRRQGYCPHRVVRVQPRASFILVSPSVSPLRREVAQCNSLIFRLQSTSTYAKRDSSLLHLTITAVGPYANTVRSSSTSTKNSP